MAKKKSFKQYSAEDKIEYHKAREKNKNLSTAKRVYSRFWLSGFFDPYAKHNLPPVIREHNEKRRSGKIKKAADRSMYTGNINGMKQRLKLDGYAAQELTKKHKR